MPEGIEGLQQNHSSAYNTIITIVNAGVEKDISSLFGMKFLDVLSNDEAEEIKNRFRDIGRPDLIYTVVDRNRESAPIHKVEKPEPKIDGVVEILPTGFEKLPGEYNDIFYRSKEGDERIEERLEKVRKYLTYLYKDQFDCDTEIIFERMPSGYFPRIKILKLPEGVNESSQLRPYLISRRSSHHTNHYEIYVDHSELKMPSDIYGDVYAKELWKLAHKKGENHFVQSHRNPLNDSVKEKEWDVIPLRPHPIQEGGAHHYEVEVTTFAGLHEKTQKNSVELFHNPSSENKLLEEALRNLCKKSARGVIEKFKESKGL